MKTCLVRIMMSCVFAMLGGCASPLFDAINRNDLDAVKQLVDRGEPVNVTRIYDWTPLMQAAFRGNAEMVGMILDKGADIDAVNDDKQTALDLAIMFGHKKAALLLIDRGAQANPLGAWSLGPVDYLIEKPDPDILRSLLAHGLDPDNKTGRNYLDKMAAKPFDADLAKMAELLLEKGAKVDGIHPYDAPLSSAATFGNLQFMRFLAQHGARLDAARKYASTGNGSKQLLEELEAGREKAAEALALKKRKDAQPCPSADVFWIFLSGQCRDGRPDGTGVADYMNSNLRFDGRFSKGYPAVGKLLRQDKAQWVVLYEGPFSGGVPHGNGVCGAEREPCTWEKGRRVDAIYLARVAKKEQEEREQQARDALARMEAEAKEQAERIEAVKACEREARRITDENTSATCDEEGNLQPYRHNRANQARNQALFNAYSSAMDNITQQAIAARAGSTGLVRPALPGAGDTVRNLTQQNQQLLQNIEQARRKLAAEQAASAAMAAGKPPVAAQPLTSAPRPVAPQWGESMPEALAVCWKNEQNYWFCDGPLQVTSVGDRDMLAARKLVGCRTDETDMRDLGSSGRYRVFGCGRGLRGGERDMRSLHGISSGGNRYRCLKKDMDAGKLCRQLSDD